MRYADFFPKSNKVQFESFPESDCFPYRNSSFSTFAVHGKPKTTLLRDITSKSVNEASSFTKAKLEYVDPLDHPSSGSREDQDTRSALEERLAAIEGGSHALTFSSGTGAINSVLQTLQTGEHMVVCEDAYSGTQYYLRKLAELRRGFTVDFVDMSNMDELRNAIKSNTRIVWTESMSNPMMKVMDIASIVQTVKQASQDILVVTDNTLASPVLVNPLLLGADVVVHSLTKYIGGHSDLSMGALIFKDEGLYEKAREASMFIGAFPGPMDCMLALESVMTLEQRMVRCTSNAYHAAHYLEKHPAVEEVLYPGLKSSSTHKLALRQMRGFGGMISIRMKGGRQEAGKFLKGLKVFTIATSLGDVQSLAEYPGSFLESALPESVRQKMGRVDNLVRLSIGQQSIEDLIEDFEQALRLSQE